MSNTAENITDIYAASSRTIAVQYVYHFILLYHTITTPMALDPQNFLATNKEEACGMRHGLKKDRKEIGTRIRAGNREENWADNGLYALIY